jgi:hypothetical protein
LKALSKARDSQVVAELEVRERVREARRCGATWAEVAEVLGCSPAWACERFKPTDLEVLIEYLPVVDGIDVAGLKRLQ